MARSATQQPTALWLFVLLVVLVSSPSITLATGDAVVKDLAFRRAAERHDGGGRATEPPQPMQLSVLVETVDGRVHAFDALSGERLWTSRAGGALVTTSISSQRADDVAPKSAIVPGVDGHLYSIKAGSRAIRRLGVHATDVVRVSPNIAGDGSIVLGSKKDAVFVLHPLTGEVLGKVSSDEAEKSPTRVAEVLESATVVVPGAKGKGGGGGAESLVPKANGAAGQGGGKIVEELRPVLVSRTEYVIKAFNHRHNEELWNVSYTDCKQLSAAEGNQIWGAARAGRQQEGRDDDDESSRRFNNAADSLKVVTTVDNTIRVASQLSGWEDLWSIRLGSTPVFASLSDSVSGQVRNIKLWQDIPGENLNGDVSVLVGFHAEGIFIMPNLREDHRFRGQIGSGSGQQGGQVAVHADLGDRLSHAMRIRGGDNSLIPFPVEDGSLDSESTDALPVILLGGEGTTRDDRGGDLEVEELRQNYQPIDLSVPVRKKDVSDGWGNWFMVFLTLLVAVLFTFGGYLYEYYGSIEQTQRRLKAEIDKIEREAVRPGPLAEIATKVSNRKKIANEEVMIGSLVVSPKILGYGSAGTIVFEGSLNHRQVAVKRLLKEFHLMAEKEIKALVASDAHPSVLRCFAMEEDEEFIYLALERCDGTLQDYVGGSDFMEALRAAVPPNHGKVNNRDVARSRRTMTQNFEIARILVPQQLLEILSDVSKALRSLHDVGIVHRDLKPQNVLLTANKKAKVSDMGLSKQLHAEQSSFDGTGMGSSGWQAPEVLLQKQRQLRSRPLGRIGEREGALDSVVLPEAGAESSDGSSGATSSTGGGIRHTKAVDVFSLGCLIFYTLTGKHPFGDLVQRDNNILQGRFDLRAMSTLHLDPPAGEAGGNSDRWKPLAPEAAEKDGEEGGPVEEGQTKEDGGEGDAKAEDPEPEEEAGYVAPWRRKSREDLEKSWGGRERFSEVAARPQPKRRIQAAYVSWSEANNMIYAMIERDPKERPKMRAVLAHPFWWSFEKRINFIVDLSHRMESEDKVTDPRLLNALESYGSDALNRKPWNRQIDLVVWEESKKFRNYSTLSVRDLTRLIRNKINHYRDNTEEVKEILGAPPNGVYTYFATTFPKLFLSLFSFACRNLRHDPLLVRYFPDDITSEDMEPFCMREGTSLLSLELPQRTPAGGKGGAEEYPRREGAEKCEYYVRSGYCRYGAACRFDHPPEYRVQRNSLGYPIRQGVPECTYFAKSGMCKYGASCRFSHPEKYLDPANRTKGDARPFPVRRRGS